MSRNPLLQKRAMDAVLVELNNPQSATDPRVDKSYNKPWGNKGTEPDMTKLGKDCDLEAVREAEAPLPTQKHDPVDPNLNPDDKMFKRSKGGYIEINMPELLAEAGGKAFVLKNFKYSEDAYDFLLEAEERLTTKLFELGYTEVGEVGPQLIDWCDNHFPSKPTAKSSAIKVAYVKHCPGHRNSQGELAEWCIYKHDTNKLLSSHKSESAAKKHLQDMHAHSGSKQAADLNVLGTKASGFAGGGPFSCMDCVHRTPHSKDADGNEVDSCSHPKVKADPELAQRKLPDGTIRVDNDDCCTYVRPTAKKKDTDVPTAETKESSGLQRRPDYKGAAVEQKETPKMLPQRDDMRGHLDEDVKKDIEKIIDKPKMEGVKVGTLACPKCSSPNTTRDPEGNRTCKKCGHTWATQSGHSDQYNGPEDHDIVKHADDPDQSHWLEQVGDARREARDAFMQDGFMQQEAQEQGITMEELWKQVGTEYANEYHGSRYGSAKKALAGVACPNCKKATVFPVVEHGVKTASAPTLAECTSCNAFFTV